MADGEGKALGYVIVDVVGANFGYMVPITTATPWQQAELPGLILAIQESHLSVIFYYTDPGVQADRAELPDGGMVHINHGKYAVYFLKDMGKVQAKVADLQRRREEEGQKKNPNRNLN